jgi:hypothetical protein
MIHLEKIDNNTFILRKRVIFDTLKNDTLHDK